MNRILHAYYSHKAFHLAQQSERLIFYVRRMEDAGYPTSRLSRLKQAAHEIRARSGEFSLAKLKTADGLRTYCHSCRRSLRLLRAGLRVSPRRGLRLRREPFVVLAPLVDAMRQTLDDIEDPAG